MGLTLYRRHGRSCEHYGKARNARGVRNCKCPIWVQGSLGGETIRESMNLTSWEAASKKVHGWESSGHIGEVKVEIPTLKEAVEKFIAHQKARGLSHETIRKYENLLSKRLVKWCVFPDLRRLNVEVVREFFNSWKDGPLYAEKNIERLRTFFRFCKPWMKENPADELAPPPSKPNPTLPFTDEQMEKILAACDRYPGNKKRIKAFVLVMRYSGLRISDTIQLSKSKVQDSRIFLRTEKTGQPVMVLIPECVTNALAELSGDQYFWNGTGKLQTRVSNWSRYLAKVFELAGVKGHSHQFRDTFATKLLLAGVSVENVAVLLGNTPKIVIKHYAPWIAERQKRLDDEVRKTM